MRLTSNFGQQKFGFSFRVALPVCLKIGKCVKATKRQHNCTISIQPTGLDNNEVA